MLRNHGRDNAYNNMYPLKIQNGIFFIIFPKQLYSTESLYLPGYTIRGTVPTIIKEIHCINLTVYKYFF